VLGFTTRLETIITSRSCTMLTMDVHAMEQLCLLNSEFKAELINIALERLRRNRVELDVCQRIAREIGLDPQAGAYTRSP
jgi:hypothetical protein